MRVNRCHFCGNVAIARFRTFDKDGDILKDAPVCLAHKRALVDEATRHGVETDDHVTVGYLSRKALASVLFIALLVFAAMGGWLLLGYFAIWLARITATIRLEGLS